VEEEEGTEEVRLLDRDFEPVVHFDAARRLASTDFTDSFFFFFAHRRRTLVISLPPFLSSLSSCLSPLYTPSPFHHRVIPLYPQRASFCRRRRLCLSF
jgi:hypothetical protein